MKVFKGKNVYIKSWCNNPEEGAINQAMNLARLPFVYHHIALMPDTHQGYGMPIGGVLATNGVVVPNAVGVDIGCGMCAVKTSLREISKYEVKEVFSKIRNMVPVGFKSRDVDQEWDGFMEVPDIKVVKDQVQKAKKQLGTLGGGNHFIELQKGDDGFIWIMIHSGSRNFGYTIAKYYNELAQDLCKKWYSNIPEYSGQDGLAFLPLNTNEGKEYIEAMNFAVKFAYANRKRMLVDIEESLYSVCECDFEPEINLPHNYATMENHFGKNVMVHRKGATSAKSGEFGIIPGSQGTSSYIVIGKGSKDSFHSCSHGAGRAMSRKKARNELDINKERKILDDMGIIHAIRNESDLDEASSAYKNIDIVMEEQHDLVDIYVKLSPLGVIKG
jgi:tRNA-splicing ligase RtcB